MTARKISELTALTTPASGDYLPIVDISEVAAANKNKRITIEELMRGAPNGTAAAPGIAFESDPNTGIYSPGADQVAISTNGTGRISIDANGNVAVDTNTLYVDAVNNRVAVGTTSPGGKFRINVQDGFLFDVGAGAYAYMRFGSQGAGEGVAELAYDRVNAKVFLKTGATGSALSTRLEIDGAGATIINNQSGTERARIDSSGRLLVGTSSALADASTVSRSLQIAGNNASTAGQFIARFDNGVNAPSLVLGKSRGATVGTYTVVNSGDQIGRIAFDATDGTKFVNSALIAAEVDGTPSADDMPGRLVFSVTADGASSPTEAMRIKNSRILNFANTPVYADNAAAKTGGLVNGDVYRKSDGTLMIVYT